MRKWDKKWVVFNYVFLACVSNADWKTEEALRNMSTVKKVISHVHNTSTFFYFGVVYYPLMQEKTQEIF